MIGMNKNEAIKIMENFRLAFLEMSELIDKLDINELHSVDHYPFKECFRDITIEVDTWLNKTIEELKEIDTKN
jgi:hypothetical protein